MIVQSILDFLSACPLLENGRIKVDHLSENASSYTVYPLPCKPVIKQYADGGTLRQYLFAFSSREYLDANDVDNIENEGFYEHFSAWLEEMTLKGILPELTKGEAQKIEALDSGYLLDDDKKTGVYQIQCKLIYYVNQEDFIYGR